MAAAAVGRARRDAGFGKRPKCAAAKGRDRAGARKPLPARGGAPALVFAGGETWAAKKNPAKPGRRNLGGEKTTWQKDAAASTDYY